MNNSLSSSRRCMATSLCFWIVLLLVGCGTKGPPVAPGSIALMAIADLKGTLDDTTFTLTWTHSAGNLRVKNYIILRAQYDLSRPDDCIGCPMVFQKIGVQAVKKKRRNQAHALAFSMDLPRGFRYTFSVRPSLSDDASGPNSNLVEVILPK